jgi:hypothetical protein
MLVVVVVMMHFRRGLGPWYEQYLSQASVQLSKNMTVVTLFDRR